MTDALSKKILFLISSHKIGLTGQLEQQALAFHSPGRAAFRFVSGEKEQFPGLFEALRQQNVDYRVIPGLDDHADFIRLARSLADHIREFRPGFVVVQTNWQLLITAVARYLTASSFRLVYVINGYRHNYRLRSRVARCVIGSALCLFADEVVAASGFLMKTFGFLGSKMKRIAIGEADIFFSHHSSPVFGGIRHFVFAGEFRTGKNQDVLIRVIRRYIDSTGDEEVQLHLPGSGENLESCIALARDLGLAHKIIFPGFLDRKEMLDLYNRCQFAFVPSNVETFGHCIAEPFVLGRVVLSRHVGVADDIIIHGETGFFFETEDDLLALMIKVLNDKELCMTVSENAYAKREMFSWPNICNEYFEKVFSSGEGPTHS